MKIIELFNFTFRFIAIEQTITKQFSAEEEREIKQFYDFHSLNTQEDWITYLNQAGFLHIEIRKSTSFVSEPDYHLSADIEPQLYEMMGKHVELTSKYLGDLDYRIYLCTK